MVFSLPATVRQSTVPCKKQEPDVECAPVGTAYRLSQDEMEHLVLNCCVWGRRAAATCTRIVTLAVARPPRAAPRPQHGCGVPTGRTPLRHARPPTRRV